MQYFELSRARVVLIRKGAFLVMAGDVMLKRFFWFERAEAFQFCEGYNAAL
jgi:hypothetical protein